MRRRSRTVSLGTVFAVAAALAAAGCADDEDERAYCATRSRVVVSDEHCDGDDADRDHVIIVGHYPGATYVPGTVLPHDPHARVVPATSPGARSAAGLPARGGFGGRGVAVSGGG